MRVVRAVRLLVAILAQLPAQIGQGLLRRLASLALGLGAPLSHLTGLLSRE